MNGNTLTLGLVGALALAGSVQRRGSRSATDTVWFHGRTARSTRFDPERVGDRYATNQEGPGFYFTTDPDEARGYAHPSGVVLRATLHIPRWVSTTAPPKRAEVERLMRASPAYEDVLTDWDESPQRAHQKALSAMLNAKSQRDAFLNVWGDFYRRADENPAYLRALVKLGYGGVHVPNPHGAPHAVVFSPDFIENVALVDDLGTGPVGSTNARSNTFGPRLPLGVGTLAYRVKRDTNDNLLLAVYSGPTRIAHMDAYWEYSMRGAEDRQEDVEKRGRGLACAKDLRALGAEGKYPNLLAVHHAFLDDASWKGKGVGRAMYEALFREAFAVRERRIGGAKGPLFAMPHACTTAGNTSDDALRVWQSLAKRYPSSGVVVRFDAEPARGSAARTAPPKHVPVERFWTISSKLEETLQDVAEGRRSYSYDAPLRVSALDTPRGHYFVLDGHHRLVEHLQAGDRTVAVELDPYTPRIERTGGAYRSMVAQKVNIAARVRRGSAARTDAYPGPLVPPTGSPKALAEAYLALRAAVPSLPVLRALYALAEADLDGAPPPTEGQISNDLYFPSPEGMAKKLREGQFPATRALLGRMPKVWPAAVALSARLRAKSVSDARKEGKKATADARWEAQAIRIDPDAMPSARALRGRDVWLYHGTTSAFLPRILREGLVPGKDARPPRKRLLGLRANLADRGGQIRFQPHVFLTADDSGRAASAGWYARQAAHVHGGDPMVLRVIVPYDALAPDPDDADIRSGRYQFVIDHVPPEAIREVDGVRRGKTR